MELEEIRRQLSPEDLAKYDRDWVCYGTAIAEQGDDGAWRYVDIREAESPLVAAAIQQTVSGGNAWAELAETLYPEAAPPQQQE